MLEISFYNHGFITKQNFYKFNCKNQKQPPEVFCKKDVFLEILQNSQEKACARGSFFNRVVGLRSSKNFLRTTFLVTTFSQNTGRLLLKNNYQIFKNFFQIFLIYEFSFRRTGELFIDSLSFVYVEKQCRSSRSQVFYLKDILKNFTKFTG